MRIIADLHIHSKYSRACSQDLTPKNIGAWADKKGISVIGTGDFTHPKWLSELKESLEETKPGLYNLRDKSAGASFVLTTEMSSIYKQGEKVRRQHTLVFAPNFAAVDRFVAALEKQGANLKADGRPITGIHCETLVKMALEADKDFFIVPAHAWTPHFGVFGSLSGFEIEEQELSYNKIISAIKNKNPKEFLYTLEFFPEEGKYHLDGHADCKFSCEPLKTKKLGGICPVCGKKLLVGVLNRVDELADRKYGFIPSSTIPFKSVIPLEEIIAETFDVGAQSKKVLEVYEKMTGKHPEFGILLDLNEEQITNISSHEIAQAIIRVREGKVHVEGGYDGVFGKIHIFSDEERDVILRKPKQMGLF